MLKIITTLAFLISSLIFGQNVNRAISMSGLKSNVGDLKVGLYNSDGSFLKSTYSSH